MPIEGFLRTHQIAGEEILLGLARTHQNRPHRERRQDAQGSSRWMAELGVVAGEENIAMTGQFGRAGETVAVHLRDNRFGQRP